VLISVIIELRMRTLITEGNDWTADSMRTVLAQVPSAVGDKEENLKRIHEVVSGQEADLFVFPELFLSGYMCRDRVHLMAEPLQGESVQELATVAEEHQCSILLGMPTLDEETTGLVHNSAVLVKPDGSAWSYDKINLATFGPFEESLYFAPGKVPTIFEVEGFRLGVVICYDLFFPELSKSLVLHGADAVICISASPNTSRDFFERIVPARAIENTAFSVYVNNAGCQLNQVFFGGSHAVGPRGNQLVKCDYFRKDVRSVDLDLSEVRAARRIRPTVRDSMGLVSQDLF
jgi:predicted amidohydrolase